jgi:predicted nuclease of predicted toxin-antitoxin system
MKFKLDENLSRSVAGLFRSAGHDAMTVCEQGLQSAPDERVLEVATQERRVLVTLDRDLGQILRFPPDASAGIVVIDVGPRASHPALLNRTRERLALVETHSPERSLWVVEPGRVRIHLAKGES